MYLNQCKWTLYIIHTLNVMLSAEVLLDISAVKAAEVLHEMKKCTVL